MTNKSNVDVAFDIVSASNSPVAFADLWAKVLEIQGLDAEACATKIGDFYSSLLLDGRFINTGDNTWDLRTRYTFDKVTLDINECYSYEDEEAEETDKEEDEEEIEDVEKGEFDEDSDEEKSEYEAE